MMMIMTTMMMMMMTVVMVVYVVHACELARARACVRTRACARVGGSDYGPRRLRCTSCATYNYDYLIAAALCNAVMPGLTHATSSRESDREGS